MKSKTSSRSRSRLEPREAAVALRPGSSAGPPPLPAATAAPRRRMRDPRMRRGAVVGRARRSRPPPGGPVASQRWSPLLGVVRRHSRTQVAGPARAGVGWSKTRVAGSRSPVPRSSRLRSSTAVSESKPRSRKARSGVDGLRAGVAEHGGGVRAGPGRAGSRSLLGRRRAAGEPAGRSCRPRRAGPVVPAAVDRATARTAHLREVADEAGSAAAEVNAGAKRSQSTSATARNVSSSATASAQRGDRAVRVPSPARRGGAAAPRPSAPAMPLAGPQPPGDGGGGQAARPGAARRARRGRRWRRRRRPGRRCPTRRRWRRTARTRRGRRRVEQLVQVRGAGDLRVQDLGDVGGGHACRSGLRPADARGVHDGAQDRARPRRRPPAARRRRRGRRRRRPRRSPRAPSSASSAGVGGAGRVGPAAAGQHQVLGALAGQPARDVPAERAGAAGDQHGAARRPLRSCRSPASDGARSEPAYEHARCLPHGELVLVAAAPRPGTASRASGRRPAVEARAGRPGRPSGPGTPARRPGPGPRPAPGRARPRSPRPVATAPRVTRPQPGAEPGVAERLHQGDGAGEPGRTPLGAAALVRRRVVASAGSSRPSSETPGESAVGRLPQPSASASRSTPLDVTEPVRRPPHRPRASASRRPSPTGVVAAFSGHDEPGPGQGTAGRRPPASGVQATR